MLWCLGEHEALDESTHRKMFICGQDTWASAPQFVKHQNQFSEPCRKDSKVSCLWHHIGAVMSVNFSKIQTTGEIQTLTSYLVFTGFIKLLTYYPNTWLQMKFATYSVDKWVSDISEYIWGILWTVSGVFYSEVWVKDLWKPTDTAIAMGPAKLQMRVSYMDNQQKSGLP